MIPTIITDYSQFDVPPYLLEQFKLTDVQKFVSLFNRQFEDFERAAFTVINGFSLQNAFGNMLDVWGIRLGLPRSGRDDPSYRTLLLVQAYINNGGGTAEELITAMRALFQVDYAGYVFNPPAKVQILEAGSLGIYVYNEWVDEFGDIMVTENNEILLFQEPDPAEQIILNEIMPAGVGLEIVFTG
jgi:hypothetical protein